LARGYWPCGACGFRSTHFLIILLTSGLHRVIELLLIVVNRGFFFLFLLYQSRSFLLLLLLLVLDLELFVALCGNLYLIADSVIDLGLALNLTLDNLVCEQSLINKAIEGAGC